MAEEPKIKERDRAAKVIGQSGDRVDVEHGGARLTVPMKGFPKGFNLRPGSKVILVDEEGGVVARPLVRGFTTREVDPAAVERRGPVTVAGRRVEVQNSTIVEQRREERGPAGEYEVWVVERADGEADEAIAIRRQ